MNNQQRLQYHRKNSPPIIHPPELTSVDEIGIIIASVEELVEWLQEKYGAVKDQARQLEEKFKKKILKLKNINGQAIPVRNR